MDLFVVWRLIAGPDESGYFSKKIGDVIAFVTDPDHIFAPHERKEFGIAKVTGIPDLKWTAIRDKIQEQVVRGKVIKNMGDGTYLIVRESILDHYKRRFRIEKALCLIEWPALAAQIELLFDPTYETPQAAIPSLGWLKFKKVFWNVADDVAETTMED